MLGGKRAREENRLPHIVKYFKICLLLVVSRLFFARCRYVQIIVGCALLVVGHFRSFLASVGRFRSFLVLVSNQNFTVLAILERLELKTFSCWPTMVANNHCSMAFHFQIHFASPGFIVPKACYKF